MPRKKQLAAIVPTFQEFQHQEFQHHKHKCLSDDYFEESSDMEKIDDLINKDKEVNINGCFAFFEFIGQLIKLWIKQRRTSQVNIVIKDS